MNPKLNILYVGDLVQGGTCLQRMKALIDLGHCVQGVDTVAQNTKSLLSLYDRSRGKLFRMGIPCACYPDRMGANAKSRDLMRTQRWDVLWIDKGLSIRRSTLEYVKETQPHCRIVGYSPDDMRGRHNQSPAFLRHLSLYDAFFTTKSYGVAELKALGCPHVFFIDNAFDLYTHRPWDLTPEERSARGGPVGFVGFYEQARACSMEFLAKSGIPVRVWGSSWRHHGHRYPHLQIVPKNVWVDDFAKTLCSFDINLAFLRKLNRDKQTTRSIEIPACGAFMLAERTDEHLALFEEGKEAEFFGSDNELIDKVKYYLAHDTERKCIAAAGRERCLRSCYSNHARLRQMLSVVQGLR